MRLETLKRRADFNRVRRGRKWTGKGFLLQALPQSDPVAGHPRFGFVVASKSLRPRDAGPNSKRPGAVLRNRAKRRLKEAIRLLQASHTQANYDYVIVGRYEALHQCFSDLLEELRIALNKVNRPPEPDNESAQPFGRRRQSGQKNQRNKGKALTARSPASGLGQPQDG